MNISSLLGTLCVFISLCIPYSIASATIVDLGTVTRDTQSGLDWLDLTETNGLAYSYVNSQLGMTGKFFGWRIATTEEAVTLWEQLGFTDNPGHKIVNPSQNILDQIAFSTGLLGNTLYESNAIFDYGSLGFVVDQPEGRADLEDFRVMIGLDRSSGSNTFNLRLYNWNVAGHIDSPLTSTGTYLVQASPVPVPSVIWLFGSGLLGLIGMGRKKKSLKCTNSNSLKRSLLIVQNS